jgi:hypothetical protein
MSTASEFKASLFSSSNLFNSYQFEECCVKDRKYTRVTVVNSTPKYYETFATDQCLQELQGQFHENESFLRNKLIPKIETVKQKCREANEEYERTLSGDAWVDVALCETSLRDLNGCRDELVGPNYNPGTTTDADLNKRSIQYRINDATRTSK